MAKTVELLLTESVENLGIVGDVVKVRTGYARNFLLPNNVATTPNQDLIESLKAKRAQAQADMAAQRAQRAETINKLTGYELAIERSCNDQGILYGSVTQQEISEALIAAGFGVRPRDVRLSHAIKRVDNYDVHVKYETELETWIKLHVKPDRVLAKDEKPDLDFDNEGNLIEKKPGKDGEKAEKKEGKAAGDKPESKKGDKHAKDEKHAEKAEKKPAAPATDEEAPKKATRKPREDAKKGSAKDAKHA
ncbi:MAG TPA: 50S ribosomal protein L9 [Phycisphaerales bacterium]|nr:50S ribosomal protein L9 [Phycisphaerales bacterium]